MKTVLVRCGTWVVGSVVLAALAACGGGGDAPAGADSALVIRGDKTVLTLGDFGSFSDPNAGDYQTEVAITTLPVDGLLLLDGVQVKQGQRITVAEVKAGRLEYVAATSPCKASDTLQFKVLDSDGRPSGQAYTLTLDTERVCKAEAPVGTPGTAAVTSSSQVLTLAAFGSFTDPNVGDYQTAVAVTTLPAQGSLTLDDVQVMVGQRITVAEIQAGKVRYKPAPQYTTDDAFQFKVLDSDGTPSVLAYTLILDMQPAGSGSGGAGSGSGMGGGGGSSASDLVFPVAMTSQFGTYLTSGETAHFTAKGPCEGTATLAQQAATLTELFEGQNHLYSIADLNASGLKKSSVPGGITQDCDPYYLNKINFSNHKTYYRSNDWGLVGMISGSGEYSVSTGTVNAFPQWMQASASGVLATLNRYTNASKNVPAGTLRFEYLAQTNPNDPTDTSTAWVKQVTYQYGANNLLELTKTLHYKVGGVGGLRLERMDYLYPNELTIQFIRQ